MTDLDDLTARLRAATEGTTPGPWQCIDFEMTAGGNGKRVVALDDECICDDEPYYPAMVKPGNSAFIAAARQLVPEAAAAIEALRAENERLREALQEISDTHNEQWHAGRIARAALTPR